MQITITKKMPGSAKLSRPRNCSRQSPMKTTVASSVIAACAQGDQFTARREIPASPPPYSAALNIDMPRTAP